MEEPGNIPTRPESVRRKAVKKRERLVQFTIMKFEKISDKKFAAFKQSEVVNPILISGGWTDTSNPGVSHDRYQDTAGTTTMDNYTQSANVTAISQDTTSGG